MDDPLIVTNNRQWFKRRICKGPRPVWSWGLRFVALLFYPRQNVLPLNTCRRLQRHLCWGLAQWIRWSWMQQKKKLHLYWAFFFIKFLTWVIDGWVCAIACDCCNRRSVAVTIKFIATNLETLVSLLKKTKHPSPPAIYRWSISMSRSLVGCRSTTTRGRERKRKTGIWQSSQQLIIGSYYWGTVSARREVGFQSLLKTLMVQNRPHYRDIISIHTLTELLGCLLGKIRFLHLRTSSLSAWLTEPCSQFVAHPRCTDGLGAHTSSVIHLRLTCRESADVARDTRCGSLVRLRVLCRVVCPPFLSPASLQKATFDNWKKGWR